MGESALFTFPVVAPRIRKVEMSGHLCVAKAPPGASEASSGQKSEQADTSKEPSVEDESEDELQEMLVRNHNH